MNHYEKQLYSVFKTFDVNNEEALDRSAVLELCDSLQLEDRGATLVDTLFERRADRVTFTQFRNGLLSVLGTEPPAPSAASPAAPPYSDDDSSGREVAPKFVFGAKKYGRRSRPQHPASEEGPRPRVASDSRLDGERARQRMRCKRSASAMEHRDGSFLTDDEDSADLDLDHDRRVDRERALGLCRSLRMHGIDRRTVERIFDEISTDEMTVGEFFDRLNSSLTSSVAATLDSAASAGGPVDHATDVVPSEVVIEAWERAGVQRPRRLLLELGFPSAALRPADLERALEDELQALGAAADEPPDARALLPRAALAVARLRTECARRLLEVAMAERDKLRADLAEANRRAVLLAQDVDENHARIEAERKASVRALEARHAEALRAAAAQAAAERERAAAARAALEDELARRADAEVRLRAELTSLREQNEELQRRSSGLEERAREAEREVARLQAERREEAGSGGARGAEPAGAAVAELEALAEALRRDNQLLRDRNDELCAALEAAGRQRAPAPAAPASWRDEVTGLRQEYESSLFTIDQKVSDREELLKRLQDFFENVEATPATEDQICKSCSTLQNTIVAIKHKVRELSENAAPAERPVEAAAQTEPASSAQEVEALREELAGVRRRHLDEKENLSTIIKELESSLEQMKFEYDKCEEYWSCKLEEERAAHGEELRAGDERLAELAAHVAAYERQFRPAAALPPIDERLALEAQVNDLQDEFAAYRRERDAELAELRARLAAAPAAPAPPAPAPAPAPPAPCPEPEGALRRQGQETAACACGSLAARWRQALGAREAAALRARAARAERAAQRLHARLHAADLLVKDLYVENCRLAHLPHAPRLP